MSSTRTGTCRASGVTEELAIALGPDGWDVTPFDAIDAADLIGPLAAVKRVQAERSCFNPEGRRSETITTPTHGVCSAFA